jgi:transketolase
MPSVELFLSQPEEYQNQVIPPNAKVITVEASATLPWYRFASRGCAIGIDTFGVSGKREDVLQTLQFDYDSLLRKIEFNITNN